MFTLEQKVDLIMRYIASSDMREVAKLKKAVAKALMDSEPTVTTKTDTNHSVEQLATEFVKNAGMPPHLLGYKYTARAIQLCIEDPGYLDGQITKRLYPDIASEFDTKPSRVERSIRHAIESIFDRCDPMYTASLFGNAVSFGKGKLTNFEFLAYAVDEITRKMKGVDIYG